MLLGYTRKQEQGVDQRRVCVYEDGVQSLSFLRTYHRTLKNMRNVENTRTKQAEFSRKNNGVF